MITFPRVPDLSDGEWSIAHKLHEQLVRRQGHNRRRDVLYEGRHKARLLGLSGGGRYLQAASVIGWPAKSVDLLAARMRVTTVDQVGGDDLGVERVLSDNDFRSEISGAITSHLLHGLAFLVSSRGGRGEPGGLIHVVDANNATGTWNPRARALDDFLSIQSRDELGVVSGFTLYQRGEQIVTAARVDGKWQVSRAAQRGVPVEVLRHAHLPGRRPFGRSRITPTLIGITSAGMRTAIRMEGHGDIYSIPQLLLLGAGADDLTAGGGSAWAKEIGAIFGLPDNDDSNASNPRAAIEQISASSPTPHIEHLRQLAQLASGETSIPVESLGVSNMSQPTSAESYMASREDLIGAAERAAETISGPIQRAVARAVAYEHGLAEVPDEWVFRTRWAPAAHASKASLADAGVKILGALPWLAQTPLGPELVGMSDEQVRRAEQYRQRAGAESLIDRLLAAQGGDVDDAG